jgi:hypothetical protein
MSQNVESRSNGSVESLRERAENCSSHLQYKQNLYIKLWKKSLNSDGQQFHQLIKYQQDEQSYLNSLNAMKDHDICCWKSMSWLAWNRLKNVVGLNQLYLLYFTLSGRGQSQI